MEYIRRNWVVAVFIFFLIEYFLNWLGKGIECVSDQNSLDESRSFKDNYLRYFDPRPAGQRKGLQLIFKNSTAL